MKPPYTISELADAMPEVTIHGDGSVVVDRFVAPNAMRGPGDLALVMEARVADALAAAPQLPIRAAVVASDFADAKHPLMDRLDAALITARPRLSLSFLTQAFSVLPDSVAGIDALAFVHETAHVDPSVRIGPHAYIGPGCVIGPNTVIMPQVTILDNAVVGADCLFYPGTRIGSRTVIGARVIMQPNACIGSDGFSFVTEDPGNFEEARTGRMVSVEIRNAPQLRVDSIGTVVIEDDVEIGAGTCVDRGTLGVCLIKKGTKLDNLVQIGHNNTIGENCLIAAETVMAGSCVVGNGVVIGGHVSISDGTKINDGAVILGGAGLMGEIEAGSVQFGAPSVDARTAFKNIANIRQIGKMRQRLSQLEKQVAALTADADADAEDSP